VEQRTWRWTEVREDQRLREFAVDFGAGTASVERLENGETARDEGEVDVVPGTTFAGFGFTIALQGFASGWSRGRQWSFRRSCSCSDPAR
jgi:hypothetical protein